MAKILIVDDERPIRILLGRTLEKLEDHGVEILEAENGNTALDIISKEKPDLVFLDIMMPDISGFDVCNTVKNEMNLKDIYIIMLTAKGQEHDKKKGMEVGADLYMTKPFNPPELYQKAAEILGIE